MNNPSSFHHKEPQENQSKWEKVLREWFPEGKKESSLKRPEEAERVEVKRRELSEEEIKEKEELLRRITEAELPLELSLEAEKEADKLREGTVKERIEKLLELAEEKGLLYAVEVAKKAENPLVMDLFHDILAKNGLFKRFQ